MPTLLILVRHALSTNNVLEDKLKSELGIDNFKPRYNKEKSCDPEIAVPLGVQQAERLASVFKDTVLDKVPKAFVGAPVELISSTMARALATALPISKELDLPVSVLPEIHEAGGCWTADLGGQPGATPEEIEALYPGFKVDPGVHSTGWWSKEGREKPEEADARAVKIAGRLQDRAKLLDGHRIVVMVTHGDWMQRLLRQIITADVHIAVDFKHLNTATTAIVLPHKEGARTQVIWINKGDHLDQEPSLRDIHDIGHEELGRSSPMSTASSGRCHSPANLHRNLTVPLMNVASTQAGGGAALPAAEER
mmetsp:Transcript_55116/g.112727  ORF Transcript_55116/g.112727 Transcript_55116/m.112727 type:complete len:309 (+) Transcript_55116:183-1109(+)